MTNFQKTCIEIDLNGMKNLVQKWHNDCKQSEDSINYLRFGYVLADIEKVQHQLNLIEEVK